MMEQYSKSDWAELKSAFLESKTAERKMRELAFHDSVTGLPNKFLFYDRLNQAILNAQRTEKALAVINLQLDLSQEAKELGRIDGDILLIEFSRRFVSILRKGDTVARSGSSSFLILAQNLTQPDSAQRVIARLLKVLNRPFRTEAGEIVIDASIGCAVYPMDGETDDDLIDSAQGAMGKSKPCEEIKQLFCSKSMRETKLNQLKLKNGLYRALERGELELYYQPQVQTESGTIQGLEALLRWHHPELGFIEPKQFLPAAEESGMILQIGSWVIQKVCEQNKSWIDRDLCRIPVAVNLSVLQLEAMDLVREIGNILRETGLPASFLQVEITENISIRAMEAVISELELLRDLGVSIAIDDFGTAYSSLSYIKRMPIHAIKIDKSFIDGIGKNFKDEEIIKNIISLTKSLSLHVIAEGVETKQQLDFLTKEGCCTIQGYYYYKPMTQGELEKLFLTEKTKDLSPSAMWGV